MQLPLYPLIRFCFQSTSTRNLNSTSNWHKLHEVQPSAKLRVLLMPELHKQVRYYLLIICWTVQVVDKTFQLHKCCAVTS